MVSDKTKKKDYVDITLKKENCQDIMIKDIPIKIKLSAWQTFSALRFDVPALHVKPTQWNYVILTFALFFSMYASVVFFVIPPLGILLLIASIVGNVIFTKNWYFRYIKKRVQEGYAPETEEEKDILKNAGIMLSPVNATNISINNQTNVTAQPNTSIPQNPPIQTSPIQASSISNPNTTPQVNVVGGGGNVQKDYMRELEKLAELKEKGILTQEEFDVQKQKILTQM